MRMIIQVNWKQFCVVSKTLFTVNFHMKQIIYPLQCKFQFCFHLFVGYLVFYTTDATQRDRDWAVEGVMGQRLTTTIMGLTPETTYYFKVQARNSKGYGPMSPTVIFRTPKGEIQCDMI